MSHHQLYSASQYQTEHPCLVLSCLEWLFPASLLRLPKPLLVLVGFVDLVISFDRC
jgi:hypothetical protein